MKNFEEKLKRLEELTNTIKQNDISLEDALSAFEEGIKLANGLEKELDSMENKIQILMNAPLQKESKSKKDSSAKEESQNAPILELFNGSSEINGTRNA